ncbi:MAG: hypothetical protein ABGY75_18220 [Gemmataceae bacterium]
MRRILILLAAAAGLAAAGCGGDGQAVSPTAPEFKQPAPPPGGQGPKIE